MVSAFNSEVHLWLWRQQQQQQLIYLPFGCKRTFRIVILLLTEGYWPPEMMVFLFRMNYRFLPILTARRFLSPFFLKGLLLFLLTHITVQKFQGQFFILKGVLLQELVFHGTRSSHWDVGHSLQYWPSLLFAPSLADLHVLLLEDLLILLQKQDDKYVLKCLGTTVIAGYQDTKVILLFLSLSTLSVSSFLIGSHNQLTCSVTL